MRMSVYYGCITIWIYCITGTHPTTILPKQDGGISSVSSATAEATQEPQTSIYEDHQGNENHLDSYNSTRNWSQICTIDMQHNIVICDPDYYCCGQGVMERKCCPKLPSGAIFGIISSVVVIGIFFVCCLVACCKWCDICPYRRAHLARKARKQSVTNSPIKTQLRTEYDVEDETGKFCEEKNHANVNNEKTDSCNQETEKINTQPDQQEKIDIAYTEIPLNNETLL